MRIASLLPAVTEWIGAFGGISDIVARSHLCDFPPDIFSVPEVTHPPPSVSAGDSVPIDQVVRGVMEPAISVNGIDLDKLAALRPDIIFVQDDDRAFAPTDLEIIRRAGCRAQVVSFAPVTLKQIIDGALRIGQVIGRGEAAMRYIAGAEQRLALLQRELGLGRRMDEQVLPSVLCLDWLEPPMAAALWTPDIIRMAGGRVAIEEAGGRARTLAWDNIVAADPDVLVVAPRGCTIEQTLHEVSGLTIRPGWDSLRAVRQGSVFVVDGVRFLNRPGPRLYRTIEVIAAAIRAGQGVAAIPGVQSWEVRRIGR